MLRRLPPLLAALLTALTCAAGASAAPFEPNDTAAQAYGPLLGDEQHVTTIETQNDQDWFFLNTTGQRQVDVTLTDLDGCGLGRVKVIALDGVLVASAETSLGADGVATASFTSPAVSRFMIEVTGVAGCDYGIDLSPADALTATSPGLIATLGRSRLTSDEDRQRILVDGQLLGELPATTTGSILIGHPAAGSRIAFEAQNGDDRWGWDVTIRDVEGHDTTTLLAEAASGGRSGSGARKGIVRRVVLDPAGTILESCGETGAPAPCFPYDDDLDGVPDGSDQCRGLPGPATSGGCPDADADGVRDDRDRCLGEAGPAATNGCPDADGDGFDDDRDLCPKLAGDFPTGCPPQRNYVTTVSIRRHGRRVTGRVLSADATCVAGRQVVLRRAGSRAIVGQATTRANGSYRMRLVGRRRGRFYVLVRAKRETRKLCRVASSRRIG